MVTGVVVVTGVDVVCGADVEGAAAVVGVVRGLVGSGVVVRTTDIGVDETAVGVVALYRIDPSPVSHLHTICRKAGRTHAAGVGVAWLFPLFAFPFPPFPRLVLLSFPPAAASPDNRLSTACRR